MSNEKRLIDANEVYELHGNYPMFARSRADLTDLQDILDEATTVDAVPIEQFNELKAENDVLKRLIHGEWVDCKDVEKALGIDFTTGLIMFAFSRTVEWNPYPLNGQKVTVKFRLKTAGDSK